MTSSWDDFEQRVSSEEALHVDSEPLAWPPSQAQVLRLAERNTNTLAAIAALEERRADIGEDDTPLMQEMLRMDAKLTALVDIVNHLLVPTETLPPRQIRALARTMRPSVTYDPAITVLLPTRMTWRTSARPSTTSTTSGSSKPLRAASMSSVSL